MSQYCYARTQRRGQMSVRRYSIDHFLSVLDEQE
jgi:hypothetical protein